MGTSPVLGVPYVGVLAGKSARGTWRLATTGAEANVEGEFELELAK